MGRPETHIDPSEGSLQLFAYELRALRRSAGNPSYRQLASRAKYSGTTLSEAARGLSFPSLAVTLAYVGACGGDTAHWRTYWQETDTALKTAETRAVHDCPKPTGGVDDLLASDPVTLRESSRRRLLVRYLPAVAGLVGVAGAAGMAGLSGHRPKTATLGVVAGTCMVSGFWLGRTIQDA
ncbi:helix-turn-helix transcriptional regulator [Streptomyces sp. NPDC051662]|uniref:helix-turn-helix transcriptional regulator n=1 Tax=Streptomyces sp. NPDC051662 TaxID=3154750 RepID=UPI00341E908C